MNTWPYNCWGNALASDQDGFIYFVGQEVLQLEPEPKFGPLHLYRLTEEGEIAPLWKLGWGGTIDVDARGHMDGAFARTNLGLGTTCLDTDQYPPP